MYWMTLKDLAVRVARLFGSLIGLHKERPTSPFTLQELRRLLHLERIKGGYEPDDRSRVQRWLDRIWEAHQMRKGRKFDWFGPRKRLRRSVRGR